MRATDALAWMTCPYCRGRLDFESIAPATGDHGIARCDCYRYPIVDGILVVRQLSGRSDTVDPAVEALSAGNVDAARALLRRHASMVGRVADSTRLERAMSAVRWATRAANESVARRRGHGQIASHTDRRGGSAPVRDALEAARPGGFAAYLFQRYANPSFAAALPALAALGPIADREVRPPRVLDLACGAGHSTFALTALFPGADIIAVDPDFVNLELLQQHFAPGAVCVCADAELPLPFDDDVLDAAVCLDAFHYIRSKWALSRELDRIINTEGIVVLPHLHNALVGNVAPGIPLAPQGYLRMFAGLEARIYSEATLLDRAVDERILDLSTMQSPESVVSAPNLTLFASRRDDVFTVHQLARRPASLGILGINPIYDAALVGDQVELQVAWPDAMLARECAEIHRHLPTRTTVGHELLARIARGAITDDDAPAVDVLRARSILVELPSGYERLDATLHRIEPSA